MSQAAEFLYYEDGEFRITDRWHEAQTENARLLATMKENPMEGADPFFISNIEDTKEEFEHTDGETLEQAMERHREKEQQERRNEEIERHIIKYVAYEKIGDLIVGDILENLPEEASRRQIIDVTEEVIDRNWGTKRSARDIAEHGINGPQPAD